jgi:hypothetical protein
VIVGAAVLPTAPLLVSGVSPTPPDGVAAVADAVDAALDSLPPYDTAVLVAVASPGAQGTGQGLYDAAEATLAGVGRPNVSRSAMVDRGAIERISRITQYPMYRGDALPLSLAVLALLIGEGGLLVPVAVPQTASFEALVSVGAGIAEGVAGEDQRAVIIAAGDLSAGLTAAAPLHEVDGARGWNDQLVDVVDSGRLDGLARLGPADAKRVGALGWAPMAVLHGACARAKVGLVVRHYSAPRGVGYLVAHGG